MTPRAGRVLQLAGAALLLAFMALLASSWVGTYGEAAGSSTAGRVFEVGGTITDYADDAVVLSGEGGERYTVLVSSGTAVRDGMVPASLSALRPGRFAAVFGATHRDGRTLTARMIMVWGGNPGSP